MDLESWFVLASSSILCLQLKTLTNQSLNTSSENLIYNTKHYVRQGFVREKGTVPDISIKLTQIVCTDVEIMRGKKEKKEWRKVGRREEGRHRSNQDGTSDHFQGWRNSENTGTSGAQRWAPGRCWYLEESWTKLVLESWIQGVIAATRPSWHGWTQSSEALPSSPNSCFPQRPSWRNPSFSGGSVSKESVCKARDLGSTLGQEDSPGEGINNPLPNSCLENSMGREGPGGLQFMGSQRVRSNWVTNTSTFIREPASKGIWEM